MPAPPARTKYQPAPWVGEQQALVLLGRQAGDQARAWFWRGFSARAPPGGWGGGAGPRPRRPAAAPPQTLQRVQSTEQLSQEAGTGAPGNSQSERQQSKYNSIWWLQRMCVSYFQLYLHWCSSP